MRTFYAKYVDHRNNAKKRGVSFLLTYDEWFKIWSDSGHLHHRGPGADQYCMARYEDQGPYAVGNVKIIQTKYNRAEASWVLSDEQRSVISARNSKLTREQARAIRKSYRPYSREFGSRALALIYDVTDGTIRKILKGRIAYYNEQDDEGVRT